MRIYVPAWLLFSFRGWDFGCDHPGCTSSAGYEDRSLARAERRLKADGWVKYPGATHACPVHVADYTGTQEVVAP